MPNINKIFENSLKKIDLSKFFGEEAYIHIKKMDKITLMKIQMLISNLPENGMVKKMLNYAKSHNISFEELQEKLNKNEIDEEILLEIMNDYEKSETDIDLMLNAQQEIYKTYIENSVISDHHNFVDDDNEKVQINNLDIFYKIFDSDTIEYIIEEIKNLNSKKKISRKKKQMK